MNNVDRVPTIDDYLKAAAHPLRQTGGRGLAIRREDKSGSRLVTVITIVKNRKETLAKTIISVLNQSYPFIEYIVIDGASTDGTLNIIKHYDDKIDFWISEPDSGTSDAFNKAVSLAKGDFIFWLSSDDWVNPDFIETAVEALLESGSDFVFGNMVMYKHENQVAVYEGDKDYVKSLMSGYPCFNFPTMVIKRECFQKVGLIDLTYKFVADYEWVLRLHLNGESGFYNSSLVVHRMAGGIGERHPIQSAFEHLRLLRKYGLPKTKAMAIYLYYLIRRAIGYLSKLLLPNIIYKKLKRVVRGG